MNTPQQEDMESSLREAALEEAAKICDGVVAAGDPGAWGATYTEAFTDGADYCADLIRAALRPAQRTSNPQQEDEK